MAIAPFLIDLNSKLTQNITNATHLSGTIRAIRRGNVVTILFAGDANKVVANEWIGLGSLNQEFQPPHAVYAPVRTNGTAWIRIVSGIEYYAYNASSTAQNFQFCVTYVVD